MKKFTIFLLACVMTFVCQQVKAQEVYEKGTNMLNAGFGFGYYGYGLVGTNSGGIPAITGNFELGIHDFISVGPYAGFKSWNYDYFGGNYGFSIFTVGARGSFHYTSFLNEALDLSIDTEKVDFYVTLLLGMEFQSYSGDLSDTAGNTRVTFGPVLGFRYMFSNNVGAYFEGGRGSLSYATLGLTFKM